jgi:hypothetical protein
MRLRERSLGRMRLGKGRVLGRNEERNECEESKEAEDRKKCEVAKEAKGQEEG